MKYLEYFENSSQLFKLIEKPDVIKFMEVYDLQDATEHMATKVVDIINNNRKSSDNKYIKLRVEIHNEQHKSIKITFGDTVSYISVFEDEYFIILVSVPDIRSRYKIPINTYYKVDGWDGLEQILKLLY
jgi:hypothetical protein